MQTASGPVHGGLDHAELRALGLDPSKVIDFSSSLNPLGTAPEVRRAIAGVDPSAYPDRRCTALREAISSHTGVPASNVLPGNGSTELIHLAARAFLAPGAPAVVFSPTFGEYDAAASNAGAEVHHLQAQESKRFAWDLPAALDAIAHLHPQVVFLCNPNNPTGVQLAIREVQTIAQATAKGILIVDEAYLPFADGQDDTTRLLRLGNVALLRSMTKDHGLAGVRLGYLLASGPVARRVERLQPTWSVSAVAQAAGVVALGCPQHVHAGREVVRNAREYFERFLPEVGLTPLPSSSNFLLVRVGDAASLRRDLLLRGICVRDCSSFGLPDYVRIGMRPIGDCERLVTELRQGLIPGPSPSERWGGESEVTRG